MPICVSHSSYCMWSLFISVCIGFIKFFVGFFKLCDSPTNMFLEWFLMRIYMEVLANRAWYDLIWCSWVHFRIHQLLKFLWRFQALWFCHNNVFWNGFWWGYMEVLASTSWNDLKILGTLGIHQFFNNSSNFGGIFKALWTFCHQTRQKEKTKKKSFGMIFVDGGGYGGTTYSMLKIWSPGKESVVYDDEF